MHTGCPASNRARVFLYPQTIRSELGWCRCRGIEIQHPSVLGLVWIRCFTVQRYSSEGLPFLSYRRRIIFRIAVKAPARNTQKYTPLDTRSPDASRPSQYADLDLLTYRPRGCIPNSNRRTT